MDMDSENAPYQWRLDFGQGTDAMTQTSQILAALKAGHCIDPLTALRRGYK